MSEENTVNGKNIQPNDEEIMAFLSEWLTNGLFTQTNKKRAVGELMRRYIQSKLTIGRIEGIVKKQKKEIAKYKRYIEERPKIGKDTQTFINLDYVKQEYISKDIIRKIIYSYNEDLEIILKIKKLLKENNNGTKKL